MMVVGGDGKVMLRVKRLRQSCRVLLCVVVVSACAPMAIAGPDILEDDLPGGDAGSIPATAAKLEGVGVLNSVKGELKGGGPGPIGVPDFEDMYQILIAAPENFSAEVVSGPKFPFNTQVWLFDISELGLLGNDDNSAGGTGSRIGRIANDGTPVIVSTPGLYYIAVTGFDNDPLSSQGPIFNQADPAEVSGPDGPGGMQPIQEWTGPPADVGDYVILFTGVELIPPPVPTTSEWGLVVMGLFLAVAATVVFGYRIRVVRA